MQTYTVIWRGAYDEVMVTEVPTNDNPDDLSNLNWVQLAACVEYADFSPEELQEILDNLEFHGYDLLNVVKGSLTYIL